MSENFDFIVVGGGSAGAVVASRLSEDPSFRVALIEAGERPPEVSLMPVAPAAMQLNPATDWMYTADPGKAGLGLNGRRVPVPRGKMLGGSSSLNYMMYVRGHPGDFDSWAAGGATGWSYAEVLPYFRKSEGLAPSADIPIDAPAHNSAGPLGVSARAPALQGANEFVEAAVAAGIPRGDYNGRERGGVAGAVSLTQYTIRQGKRSSTYYAFLEGEPERRPNLTIITGAQATRVILEGEAGQLTATGVEYRTGTGEILIAHAGKDDFERRRDRLASFIAAVRYRAAAGTGRSWCSLPTGSAACRQAFERPPGGAIVLSRAGGRCVDERGRALGGTRGSPRTWGTAARRSRR
ncbi:MAG: GMC family oxidoreductase N-terminal domain-containing protein [Stellaceae bacterium]